MHLLPNGLALITSGLKGGPRPRLNNSPGQLYTFDFKNPKDPAKPVPCDNLPGYGTKDRAFAGLDIYQVKSGVVYIFAVSPGKELNTVEKFMYDLKNNKLEHRKTYKDDKFRFLNDVVAIGADSFYATNTAHHKEALFILEALVAGVHWGSVVKYDNGKVR